MTRREAILSALCAPIAAALSGYRSVGYIHGRDARARRVVSVTVNGVEYIHKKVIEGDDRKGWIRAYVRDEQGRIVIDTQAYTLKTEIVRGRVRFSFGDWR